MTRALAAEIPGAEASRLEIDRGGPSYSVVTVEEILAAAAEPAPEVFLVVGADLVPELQTWERPEDLKRLATLAVVSRPASPDAGGSAGVAGGTGRRSRASMCPAQRCANASPPARASPVSSRTR